MHSVFIFLQVPRAQPRYMIEIKLTVCYTTYARASTQIPRPTWMHSAYVWPPQLSGHARHHGGAERSREHLARGQTRSNGNRSQPVCPHDGGVWRFVAALKIMSLFLKFRI